MSETTDRTPLEQGGDPGDYTVAEVTAHLVGADDTERERVLAAERAGQGRVGIVGHDTTAPTGEGEAGTGETTTRAETFQSAAAAATPDDGPGFIGTSPEAERTGRRDKGLSQQNPAILSGGPVPDPRPGVDDQAGLDALREG